jgi:hypothetical protein
MGAKFGTNEKVGQIRTDERYKIWEGDRKFPNFGVLPLFRPLLEPHEALLNLRMNLVSSFHQSPPHAT